jgi:hypothetical protein
MKNIRNLKGRMTWTIAVTFAFNPLQRESLKNAEASVDLTERSKMLRFQRK